VPTFIVGGLHDLFQRGEPMHYERLRQRITTKLLIGPWTHVAASTGAPLAGPGVGLPADGVPDYDHIALQWFDQYLKGMNVHADALPPVTYYNYGDDKFETQADWPLPTLAPTRWYLRGTGGYAGNFGGSLDRTAPTADEGSDQWLQQPVSGICTQSTGQWTAGAGDALPCTTHDEANEIAEVKFSTPPLEQELRFQGPVLAHLWLQTTASDIVVSVRLTDVAPDGSSKELTAGWLAGSLRATDLAKSRVVRGELLQPWHPFTKDSVLPVPSGEPVELDVEIFPTNATILPGHELRVAVGPSDFPHAVSPTPQLANTLGGAVTLLRDAEHPSYVTLPTIGTDCALPGCKPLPVPDMVRH
jgi:putative CocE/NonD family hydrolase